VTPRLSVIVLNFNGRQWLDACLTAVSAQAGAPSFEVLFVDNGSTDGSISFVGDRFPSVRIVDNGRNMGFAGGNNAGAWASRGDWLVFLNNDTVPDTDWLARLHASTSIAGRDVITSRIVYLYRPDIVDSAGDGYLRVGGGFKHGHSRAAADFLASREVFGACGAAFAIARETFDRLGGFDDHFFMVYEDVDLSYRARLAGYRCWYAADAVVRHAGSSTLGTMSPTAVFYGQRNLEWTWFKNTPARLLWRTLPGHAVYSLAGVLHYMRRGRGWSALKGKVAALAALPRLIEQRRQVQRSRLVGVESLERHLEAGWIARKRAEKAGITATR
jgi:GT2 family glycosyltransferase